MLYPLTGFPFDLLLGIIIAFAFKPNIKIIYLIGITLVLMVPGFFIPYPNVVMYWAPGGAASMVIGAVFISYFLSSDRLIKNMTLSKVPDRRFLRSELLKVSTVEERQQEYLKMIGRIARTQERNNSEIIKLNTAFFLALFFVLFAVNFSAMTFIYVKSPDVLKKLFEDFYNTVIMEPGKYEDWFSGLIELAAFQVFVAEILFCLLILYIIDRILSYRNIRQPVVGSPLFFQLPFYVLWLYILSGVFLFLAIKFNPPEIYLLLAKNVFGIFCALYIFQGLSVAWLYFQVRLLPGGSIIFFAVFLALLLPALSLFTFAILLSIGLLDFWVDLRKKALQPNLMSNGV